LTPYSRHSAYKYDALGRRIEKRDRSGTIRRYYYDGFDLIAEYDGSNNLLATYTFGPGIDNPISMYYAGDIYYYHTDALDSITEMTDDNEAVAQSYDYSAFGKILSQSGSLASVNPFTYTARELDSESGLYYYRYRYYDAETGRFINHDPIYWLGGVNLYLYVANNPLRFSDMLGINPNESHPSCWSEGYLTPDEHALAELDRIAREGSAAVRGALSSAGRNAGRTAKYIGLKGASKGLAGLAAAGSVINKVPPDVQTGSTIASALAALTRNPTWLRSSGWLGIAASATGALEDKNRHWSEQLDDKADDIEFDP
jgi:RHS repeat-associated protein